jgi:hypothetical protein
MSIEQSSDTADVIERLTALPRPCPDCGALLVGARCLGAPAPGQMRQAFLGLVCTVCDAMYSLAKGDEE